MKILMIRDMPNRLNYTPILREVRGALERINTLIPNLLITILRNPNQMSSEGSVISYTSI